MKEYSSLACSLYGPTLNNDPPPPYPFPYPPPPPPTSPLNPFRGLHQTAHWSTVRWLGGFGTSRLSGTHDISTTSDNDDDNNNNSRSCGGGESTVVPATGVGVVAMETASDQRGGKDGLGGAERLNRPWWERVRWACCVIARNDVDLHSIIHRQGYAFLIL